MSGHIILTASIKVELSYDQAGIDVNSDDGYGVWLASSKQQYCIHLTIAKFPIVAVHHGVYEHPVP